MYLIKKRENISDHDIYSGIAEMFELVDNPHNWFTDVYLRDSEIGKAAKEKSQQAIKKAQKVMEDAANEFRNKRRCIVVERKTREKHVNISDLTTPTAKGAGSLAPRPHFGMIGVGVAVEVQADLSPGKCSHGGEAHVIDVDGSVTSAKFTVRYTKPLGETTQRGIRYNQLLRMENVVFIL